MISDFWGIVSLLDDSAFLLDFSGVADLVLVASSVEDFFVFKMDLMGFLGDEYILYGDVVLVLNLVCGVVVLVFNLLVLDDLFKLG